MTGSNPASTSPAILINGITQLDISNNQFADFINRYTATNTAYVYDADGYGGTVKGQLGIGNLAPGRGYRGFSNIGITLAEDLTGVLIKTDLASTENSNVILKINGLADAPINAVLQVAPFGNGTIVSPVWINNGGGIDSAKAFYLSGKLCFWIKPNTNYSNLNFEIQTTGQQTQIVDRLVSAVPGGITGSVDLVKANTVVSGTYTPTTSSLTNCTVSNVSGTYTRIGNIVTATISLSLSATTGSLDTSLNLSLPISTTLITGNVVSGSIRNNSATAYMPAWGILQTGSLVNVHFISNGTGAHTGSITIQYSTQ